MELKEAETVAQPKRRSHRVLLASFLTPGLIWLAAFIAVPYMILFLYSIWKTNYVEIIKSPTFDNVHRLVTDQVVRTVALRSALIALIVTVAAFAMTFPLAYLAAFHIKRKKVFVFAVILPMWVSYIVRAYAWRIILGQDGILNGMLQALHLTDHPISAFLFSPLAVIITLTHVYMAFMFVPMYSVLEGLPKSYFRAASDLYANPFRRFMRVTLPLAAPGIAAGVMFVFPLAFGDYIAPSLVGGTNSTMIANLVQSEFGVTFNWPFGAAIVLGLLTVVLLVIGMMERWRGIEDVKLV
jgi:spermidine/putrescine transport system permease protein